MIMSRYENLIETINKQNETATSYNEWLLMLLTDIAMSLAVIADETTVNKKDDKSEWLNA